MLEIIKLAILPVFVVIFLLVAFYLAYISLIKREKKVKEANSRINTHLEMYYDLIPNILAIADKFMKTENELIQDISDCIKKALLIPDDEIYFEEKIILFNKIKDKMQELFLSVENYPQLKTDATLDVAIKTYGEIENHITEGGKIF